MNLTPDLKVTRLAPGYQQDNAGGNPAKRLGSHPRGE